MVDANVGVQKMTKSTSVVSAPQNPFLRGAEQS